MCVCVFWSVLSVSYVCFFFLLLKMLIAAFFSLGGKHTQTHIEIKFHTRALSVASGQAEGEVVMIEGYQVRNISPLFKNSFF